MNFDVIVNGRPWRVGIEAAEGSGPVQVSIKGAKRSFSASWIDANTLSLIALDGEGRVREFGLRSQNAGRFEVTTAGRVFHAAVALDGQSKPRYAHRKEHTAEVEGRQEIVSSMPGRIVRVLVKVGDAVTAGQPVVVVEAMKMENEMRAPKDGVVREVRATEGAAIDAGALLVVID